MSIRNIYYSSSQVDNQNITTTDLTSESITTSGLTFKGATKGQILIIGDTNGNVDGLDLGTTNDVLVANPSNNGLPGYTNALSINTLTANDIKINGLINGDLLIGVTNDFVDRLPIGPNGYLLSSNGTDPIWSPLTLPFTNGALFVDGGGTVYSERPSYAISAIPVTFTTSTTIFSLNTNVVGSRNYKVSVSWNNLITSGGQNTYSLSISSFGTVLSFVTSNTSSQENIIFPFQSSGTGSITISLIGAHTGGSGTPNGTANKVVITLEPLGF